MLGRGLKGLVAFLIEGSYALLWAAPSHVSMRGGDVCVTQAYFSGGLNERTRLSTLTTFFSLFVEEVRKALLSSHCSCPPQLAGWQLGQGDKRDLASSRSCVQLKVCLLKPSPVGQHLCTRDTLKTISESQKPQQKMLNSHCFLPPLLQKLLLTWEYDMIAIRRDKASDNLALFFLLWLLFCRWCLFFWRKSSQQ